ncbi:hypothetical protein A3C87_02785 [Candidatus Kaiserbacteria bacterium RIFCSPHIGHO2_02_FULL_49_34]|uniref:Lipoprotein n=1 Tax=Candidatus Kaiserbacteria bacterium RIFCSPHIGHO2_02_FULL_49_34 TaxID=1798491 RepID=A0A1F6DJQ4_9BACT|nr:MAG: hypothetical protein A3C87_02785 [Candidatus Kaiserbacteria bacterium RIFCSPHIGHO2_02_FULL_49_34]
MNYFNRVSAALLFLVFLMMPLTGCSADEPSNKEIEQSLMEGLQKDFPHSKYGWADLYSFKKTEGHKAGQEGFYTLFYSFEFAFSRDVGKFINGSMGFTSDLNHCRRYSNDCKIILKGAMIHAKGETTFRKTGEGWIPYRKTWTNFTPTP